MSMAPLFRSFCLSALLPVTAVAAEYDCLIEARQKVDIRSPVEAVIESVQVQRGGRIDCRLQRNRRSDFRPSGRAEALSRGS